MRLPVLASMVLLWCVPPLHAQDGPPEALSPQTQAFDSLYRSAMRYRQLGQYIDAEGVFEEAVQTYERLPEKRGVKVSYRKLWTSVGANALDLASLLIRQKDYVAVYGQYQKAQDAFRKANDQSALVQAYRLHAEFFGYLRRSDRHERAIRLYDELLSLPDLTRPRPILEAVDLLAAQYLESGQEDEAILAYERAYHKIAQNALDESYTFMVHLRTARLFYDHYVEHPEKEGYLLKANAYFQTGLQRFEEPKWQAALYVGLGDCELLQGKRASFFQHYTKAIDLYKEAGEWAEVAEVCRVAAQTHYEAEEYDRMPAYLEEGSAALEKLSAEEALPLRKKLLKLQEDLALALEVSRLRGDRQSLHDQLEAKQKELFLEEKLRQRTNFLVILSSLTVLLLAASYSYYRSRKAHGILQLQYEKINEQNEQITASKEEIDGKRKEISQAYANIRNISEMGQAITASLKREEVIGYIQRNMYRLTVAEFFGIGLFEPERKELDFVMFSKMGSVKTEYAEPTDNINSLAVSCLMSKQERVVNNEDRPERVIKGIDLGKRDSPQSLAFLPLVVEQKAIGVITAQSYAPNAYGEREMAVLRSLAAYLSIALDNVRAYSIIEEKNDKITDSIRYGQAIQEAILPQPEEIANGPVDDYFVFFRPKDIVSGDFYWFAHVEQEGEAPQAVAAAIDCTGHGVPGAFMSMIGNTLLDEIVNQNRITDPGEVLTLLHRLVRKALRQENHANQDGMDVALCRIVPNAEMQTVRVDFCGAKRPLYYADKNEGFTLRKLKGERKSIGGFQKEEERSFSTQTVELAAGSCLYLTTDGYVDQNAPDRRKFGSEAFEGLLREVVSRPFGSQRERIEQAFDTHRKSADQRDDVTLFAVRV